MFQINAHAYKEMLKENLQKQSARKRPTVDVGNAAPNIMLVSSTRTLHTTREPSRRDSCAELPCLFFANPDKPKYARIISPKPA